LSHSHKQDSLFPQNMTMPTQTTTMPEPSSSQPAPKPVPTKAERRELQERQRAAKLAQKQSNQPTPGTSSSKTPSQTQKKPETSKPGHKPRASSVSTKDVPVVSKVPRGLQIFSHFIQPKPVGQGVKGDIHPVIARLSLQFSEFKICGSNARCIAVLTAFKTVSNALALILESISDHP
jgi:translation initiation factor eIF-2B subunit delta